MDNVRKYVFTGVTKSIGELVLHQIKRLSDGLIGGWIEKEENLSQVFGDAWVSGNARVSGDAQVSGNAWVLGSAQVSGDAQVFGDAQVSGNAWVFGSAQVSGNAQVFGDARVFGDAQVFGNARVSGDAQVSGDAWVLGSAQVSGDAQVEKYRQCIHINNLQFLITVTPQNAVIGCQMKTHKEWLKITQREALEMGLKKENIKLFKTLLPLLFEAVKQ